MNEPSPSVSVIVPNYNHAKFLKQRIDSILSQTFQDFELILLDDASTDDSVSILQTYASHPKVARVVFNETNSGSPFHQWKKGFEMSSGPLVWIAESDDWADRNFLKQVCRILGEHPNCVVAHCNSMMVDKEGSPLGPRRNRSLPDELVDGKTETAERMRFWNSIPNASAAVFRREAVNDSMFPTTMRFCGDCVFWIRLMQQGSVFFTSEFLNYTRMHDNTNQHQIDPMKEFVRLQEHFDAISLAIELGGSRGLSRKPYRYLFQLWRQARRKSWRWWKLPTANKRLLALLILDDTVAPFRAGLDFSRRLGNRLTRRLER